MLTRQDTATVVTGPQGSLVGADPAATSIIGPVLTTGSVGRVANAIQERIKRSLATSDSSQGPSRDRGSRSRLEGDRRRYTRRRPSHGRFETWLTAF